MFADRLSERKFVTLRVAVEAELCHVRLQRPNAFNAISMEMLQELHDLMDMLDHPKSMFMDLPLDFPRVVLLSGEGMAFSGGVDIKAADRAIGGRSWDYKNMRSQELLSRLIHKIRNVPQPFIAAVQGPAAGAGLALALACDIRVALRSASFSAAFVRLALAGTDMGTSFFLPRIAGMGIASEMLLTGSSLGAERAYQVGLVNDVVNSVSELEASARNFAELMLGCSKLGLQLTKKQLQSASEGVSLNAAMTAENSHQMLLINDKESARVAQDWLNKLLGNKEDNTSNKVNHISSKTSSKAKTVISKL